MSTAAALPVSPQEEQAQMVAALKSRGTRCEMHNPVDCDGKYPGQARLWCSACIVRHLRAAAVPPPPREEPTERERATSGDVIEAAYRLEKELREHLPTFPVASHGLRHVMEKHLSAFMLRFQGAAAALQPSDSVKASTTAGEHEQRNYEAPSRLNVEEDAAYRREACARNEAAMHPRQDVQTASLSGRQRIAASTTAESESQS